MLHNHHYFNKIGTLIVRNTIMVRIGIIIVTHALAGNFVTLYIPTNA